MTEPTELSDARWRRLVDREALGEPLLADDAAFLAEYVPRGAPARAERGLLDRLRGGPGPASLEEDERTIAAVLEAFTAGGPAANEAPESAREAIPPRAGGPSGRLLGLTSIAAVVVGVLAAFLLIRGDDSARARPVARSIAAAPEPFEVVSSLAAAADAVTSPAVAIEPGAVVADGGRWLTRDGKEPAALVGEPLRAASDRACLRIAGVSSCFERDARVHVEPGELQVLEGRGRLTLSSTRFEVRVAGDRYSMEGPEPAVVWVEVRPRGPWEVRVESGRVRVWGEQALEAGDRRAGHPPRARRSKTASSTLLSRARALRAEGDVAGAIAAYEALVRDHAASPATKPALVALGQLHLEAGRPRKALRWFRRYLDDGPALLAEEAHYGQVRALQQLGDPAEARRALAVFAADYPESVYVRRLRKSGL